MTNLRETSVAFLKPVLVVVNKFIFILHTQSDLKHQIYRKGVTKTQTSKTQTPGLPGCIETLDPRETLIP